MFQATNTSHIARMNLLIRSQYRFYTTGRKRCIRKAMISVEMVFKCLCTSFHAGPTISALKASTYSSRRVNIFLVIFSIQYRTIGLKDCSQCTRPCCMLKKSREERRGRVVSTKKRPKAKWEGKEKREKRERGRRFTPKVYGRESAP